MNAWMVRSDGGEALDLFEKGIVGIEFGVPVSLKGKGQEEIRLLHKHYNSEDSKEKRAGAVGMLERMANVIQVGDGVITYDPKTRRYWIGRVTGGYFFTENDDYLPHRRQVQWQPKTVSRDDLSITARNSLGSTLTLFSVSPEIWAEFEKLLRDEKPDPIIAAEEAKQELALEKRNVIEESRERVKDRIAALDADQMEEMLAALLRAMGFRTRISPKGPDRGVDVFASPDGLGLQEPRIKCEVKHRKSTQMGSQDIRSFIGALRGGDRAIYLSTGGFTREARYESDRANVPVTLMDLDDLARLIETHYEAFDAEGKALLPLTKIFWPAD
jgi:restriction system protein